MLIIHEHNSLLVKYSDMMFLSEKLNGSAYCSLEKSVSCSLQILLRNKFDFDAKSFLTNLVKKHPVAFLKQNNIILRFVTSTLKSITQDNQKELSILETLSQVYASIPVVMYLYFNDHEDESLFNIVNCLLVSFIK